MGKIRLGQITAPVGIKGEIRVYPYLEQTRFSDIEKVCVDNSAPVKIEKLRYDKNMLVIKLSGTGSRNDAEALRGKYLYLPEGEELDLGEDTFYIEELKGCRVVENGTELGTVTGVISRHFQDLYEVQKPDGKSFLMPAVHEFIKSIDTGEKVINVSLPEGLTDL